MNEKLALIVGTFVLQIAALQAENEQLRSSLVTSPAKSRKQPGKST
jgi:hypothetical protein